MCVVIHMQIGNHIITSEICLNLHESMRPGRDQTRDPWICSQTRICNVSGYRCVSDCRSRGHEFDPGPVPYFRGDNSWNHFYGHSPPFRWTIQEGLLSVTSESMCTKYWLTACSSFCPEKSVVRWTDRPTMTIAVDMGRTASKQTNCLPKYPYWGFQYTKC